MAKVPNQNKTARTDQTKLKRTAWTRADIHRIRKGRLDLSRAEQMIRDRINTRGAIRKNKPEQSLPGGHRREETGAVQTKANRPEQTSQNRPNQTEENSSDQSRQNSNDETRNKQSDQQTTPIITQTKPASQIEPSRPHHN